MVVSTGQIAFQTGTVILDGEIRGKLTKSGVGTFLTVLYVT